MKRSSRFNPRTIPSIPLLEDRIHILGPPADMKSAAVSWEMIWKRFTSESWMAIIICIIGHGIARLWMSFHFSWNSRIGFSWEQFRARFFGRYYTNMSLEDDNEENWMHMNSIWVMIAKLFFGIVWILWEVETAVNVFERENSIQLMKFDPAEFAISKDSTIENFFDNLMNRTRTLGV